MNIRKAIVAFEDWVDDPSTIIELLKGGFVAVVVFGLLFAPLVYWLGKSDADDPHIVLNKTEWSCSHTREMMVPILVGKLIVPTQETVCDTWEMN